MEDKVNSTYLCLIPKYPNATSLKNYRPIELCNTQYKIITKLIANRIKPHLQNIIGQSQSSFLTGRRTFDNAMIFQEYISHFTRIKEKKANMILKNNIEKSLIEFSGLLLNKLCFLTFLLTSSDLSCPVSPPPLFQSLLIEVRLSTLDL